MIRAARYIAFIALATAAALSAQTASKAKAWTQPRTADGQPDLQGIWNSVTATPLERPADLAGKAFFTPAEAAAYAKKMREQANVDRPEARRPGDPGGYNEAWFDRATSTVKSLRTSLIVDPPDGKIPPLTAEGERRAAGCGKERREHATDGPEYRTLNERCILWGTAGPPMMPAGYNSNYQILQSPGYVTIVIEMIHEVRQIPLDGHPHLPSSVRQWMGDSRGHWEGNTLVVDTTNFTDKTRFRGASENMHLTERFTRTDAETIQYEFTVDDPTAFTKPWTAAMNMTRTQGPIYEYACQEGNYALVDILAGARVTEGGK